MKTIITARVSAPGGHYSQAIVHGGMVYTSGQLGVDPKTRKAADSIEEQTEQALKNLSAVLVAAGSDINNVVKVTLYLTDINNFAVVNKIYAQFFGEHAPARSTAPAGPLPANYLVEIDAVAVVTGEV